MNSGSIHNPSQPFKLIRPLDDFSASAIDVWISQLPLSDIDGASDAIHGLLKKVNMTDGLECQERLRIVEQIRPPTVSLLAMSSERHLPSPTLFPLPASQYRHVQRSVEMCLELANAYRRIVTSGTFFSDKVMSDAGRAQVVYRALQSYGLALLRSLERYESPPPGFWRDAYSFYQFAEGHRLQYLALPTPEVDGATVDSQFKQIILLALSSHQHHAPDEIRQFYIALMLIAKDAEFAGSQELSGETSLYYFDIGTDKTPRPIKRAKPLKTGERRYLFIAKMLENARQYFSNPAQRAPDRFKLKPDVIMSLLEALSATEKRRFVRLPTSGNRFFVVGLARLLKGLSGDAPISLPDAYPDRLPEPSLTHEDDEEDEEIVIGQPQDDGGDSIWLQGGYSGKAEFSDYLRVAEDRGLDSPAESLLAGALLNSSAGGYCLQWLNPLVAGARIGELIGIYEEEERIHVGVIRWLHHKSKAELVIGVELLPPQVEAVTIENGMEVGAPQQGLHFQANEKLGQPASLLCGPGVFRVGQLVAFRGRAGSLQTFRLEKVLVATFSFQLFSLGRTGDS